MAISIVDIASEIYVDLAQPTNLVVPEIVFWLKGHVGDLNNLILTSFSIDDNQQISPDTSFGEDEKSIFKALYVIKYYEFLARNMLGAAGIETALEWGSDGHVIRKLNRVTLAQVYNQIRKELKDELYKYITFYKINRSNSKSIEGQELLQIVGFTPRYNRILNQGL